MQPLIRNKYCFYSGLAAAGIMLFVFLVFQVSPLGGSTVLRMDLYHQYGPMFAEFYERVTNFDSLLYSWTSGMGSSFLGNLLNYISSPFVIFIFLFGHKNMPESIAAMMLCCASFSAGTFTYYIKKTFGKHDLSSAAFGLLYAFCGYFVAYSWNIMWLDAMIILPIVFLGLQYLVDSKKPYVYIFGLVYAMLTNYYMAFMLCVASVVYFFIYYYSKDRKSTFVKLLKTGVKFGLSSLLAVGLVAVLLLPLYFILQASSATGNPFPTKYESYFSIYDFLANHLAGVEPTIRSSGGDVFPNIYSGILTLMLIPLYLYTKSISLREKVTSILLLVFFYFSFNINFMNFAWHGFKFPNDLPYRQSFIYSFIIVVLAYKAFMHLHEFTSRQILTAGLGVIGFVVLVQEIGQKNVSETVVWASISFVVVYVIVLSMLKNPKYQLKSMTLLLMFAVCTELLVCNTPNYVMTQKKEHYTSDYQDFVSIHNDVKDTEDSDTFYREELTYLRTRMDPSWYYYNGVSVFSSMAYENVSRLQNRLGMFSNAINSHTYNLQTPIYNSMFALKYLYDKDMRITDTGKGTYYDYLLSNGTFTAYEYDKFLPIAFGVNADMGEQFIFEDNETDPFELQSELFTAATGVSGFFEPLDVGIANSEAQNCDPIYNDYNPASPYIYYKKTSAKQTGEFVLTIDVEEDQNVYIYTSSDTIKSVTLGSATRTPEAGTEYDSPLYESGANSYSNFTFGSISLDTQGNDAHIYDTGFHKAGTTLAIKVSIPADVDSGSVTFRAMTLNQKAFEAGYNRILANGTLQVDTFKETYIKGSIDIASDMLLYTSIPYDEGWAVKIDGETVSVEDYQAIGKAYLAVPIAQGSHTVEFQYRPKGMLLGAGISVVSVLLLIAYYVLSKKQGFANNISKRLPGHQKRLLLQAVRSDIGPQAIGFIPFEEQETPADADAKDDLPVEQPPAGTPEPPQEQQTGAEDSAPPSQE
jgi:uncharacterized membrane protein YfhO